jgi:hypothetical protein
MNTPIFDRFSDEVLFSISQDYISGLNCYDLGEKYKISYSSAYKILKKLNTPIRTSSERSRIYTCNHSFFDIIQTEHQAYWLGFLAADGYIGKNNHIALHLKLEDTDHLYRFRESLESNHPVKIYKYPYQSLAKIVITSPQLVADLAKYGIVNNKSCSLKWPQVDDKLIVHFIRGYFDGDGGFLISHHKGDKSPRISASITSTQSILEGIRDYFTIQCNLPQPLIIKAYRGKVYCIRYCHREAVKRIADIFYRDATIFLPRKYERVTQYLIDYPPDGRKFNNRCGKPQK